MSTTVQITPIKAFNDNYIWCIHNTQHSLVVDPGDAAPVVAHLQQQQLSLQGILITHHHWDHTDGIEQLLAIYPDIPVFGPHNHITTITHRLCEGEQLHLPSLDIAMQVLAVPGHTLDHIAYYGDIGLFCGDTLFSAGCGRLFEGSPAQMLDAMDKFKQLPDQTKVYCTHEYTLANLAFAQAVEPQNLNVQQYSQWVRQQRENSAATLPSQIGQEKAINPFMRTDNAQVKMAIERHCQQSLSDEVAVFTQLRRWKDNF